eukprot:SM000072S21217  [mRNA]  locus=s72:401220:402763:+ [translate_table: standard]
MAVRAKQARCLWAATLALAAATQLCTPVAAAGRHFWQPFNMTATFYGGPNAENTGGACGYGDMFTAGYGTSTVAASSMLFKDGQSCGACYQVRCVNAVGCIKDTYIQITVTNYCPPRTDMSTPGWCDGDNMHFDMSQPAFTQIADYSAGVVPVEVMRVPCTRDGNIQWQVGGNPNWLQLNIRNIAGDGDIAAISVKGTNTDWVTMTQSFGVTWQADGMFQGQALSFRVTSLLTGKVLQVDDAVPAGWTVGSVYTAGQYPEVKTKPRGSKLGHFVTASTNP